MSDISDLVAVVQQLNRDLLAIEMARSGLARQMDLVERIPLVDPITGLPVSKTEFKELGSARLIVGQVGIEAAIGLASNAIETFAIRMKRHLAVVWEPFAHPRNDIRFAERVCQIRALNNVFKHQEGYIDVSSSRSAKYLVSAGQFKDGTYLKHLPAEHILPAPELTISEAFAHLYEIAFAASGLAHALTKETGQGLIDALRDMAVYSVISPILRDIGGK